MKGLACRKEVAILILVVGKSVQGRQLLVQQYLENIKPCISIQGDEQILVAGSVKGAIEQISTGLNLTFIIFSEEFPEREQKKIRKYFDSKPGMAVPNFITFQPFHQQS